jgi:tRNA1(Val) A37 N6-methylase TrmN6
LLPGEGEDHCLLSGDWRILQQTRGHRWSLDDLVTAWVAAEARAANPPARALDVGCGIGSVLMMIAWRFPTARCTGVEAQEISLGMARRSLAWNGADDRCEVKLGDLRDASVLGSREEHARFDLVTGTPPYFPPGEGVESEKVQCAPCRFEHRGGVEDYCAAGARWLAEGGTFVMCSASGEAERVIAGARAAGLVIRAWLDVIPRERKRPLVSVFTMDRSPGGPELARAELVVRNAKGEWTPEFAEVRRAMGMPSRVP